MSRTAPGARGVPGHLAFEGLDAARDRLPQPRGAYVQPRGAYVQPLDAYVQPAGRASRWKSVVTPWASTSRESGEVLGDSENEEVDALGAFTQPFYADDYVYAPRRAAH